ncbi:gamma-glutamyl phosphate reductase [Raphidiopsis curvata NIES-932]|nr:gamma-glutamyl phosphate reductase [Raphidiopsis curvata NIES-932]
MSLDISLQHTSTLKEIAQKTRLAALNLSLLTSKQKDYALDTIALALESAQEEILQANIADCQNAMSQSISKSLYKRLYLDSNKLQEAIAGVRDLVKLKDPVGQVQIHREIDRGLILKRITCPLGVLGVIFEARPEAAIQIVSLAIKSGNGVILKGGREAIGSCEAIVKAIKQGLSKTDINPDVVQLLTTREEILELLNLDKYVDLIIPRGSNSFVRFVQENTRIPVLGHADGICHLYVDKAADIHKAIDITIDAKTQYAAACNAIETLLIHSSIAQEFLPQVASALESENVELRGDNRTLDILPKIELATEKDWQTEYSDLILSIKIVDSLEEAIAHISEYGSRHTEAIVTEDLIAANTFQALVNAAGVYHNCSTRFADGFRYGFGAEVGISTQQMPPRGPVGLEGLVTYKYHLIGDGHVVKTYTGDRRKGFTHKDLGV